MAEASGERGWGYDGADLWAPHHAYGGPDGLKRLVDACHARGLAVVLDVVYNHLGPAGNYLGEFGPYFTDHYRTPWGAAVNMDGAGSYGVRDFVISNALMWLRDYHIDGLRLDAVHAIYDEGALHILEELSAAVAGSGRRARPRAVGHRRERPQRPPVVPSRGSSSGYGVGARVGRRFPPRPARRADGGGHGLLRRFRPSRPVGQGVRACLCLRRRVLRVPPAPPRAAGRRICPGACFVCCLQNHDQVGNRATGRAHLVAWSARTC